MINVIVPLEVRGYYLMKLGRDNKNIVSGLNEVFAFAIQRSAINVYKKSEPFLETISRGLNEILDRLNQIRMVIISASDKKSFLNLLTA